MCVMKLFIHSQTFYWIELLTRADIKTYSMLVNGITDIKYLIL